MNRRRFLQFLGIAPVAVVAAKYLPKQPAMTGQICKGTSIDTWQPVTFTRDWRPHTAYKVGDKVKVTIRGKADEYTVVGAGTTGNDTDWLHYGVDDVKLFESGTARLMNHPQFV